MDAEDFAAIAAGFQESLKPYQEGYPKYDAAAW